MKVSDNILRKAYNNYFDYTVLKSVDDFYFSREGFKENVYTNDYLFSYLKPYLKEERLNKLKRIIDES